MPIKKRIPKQTGKKSFLNALDGTKQHKLMMRLNNCISGRCDLCHWDILWQCYNKLRKHLLKEAQGKVYEYLKTKK